MIVEHLEAFEIALIAWTFTFALIGLQGLVSIFLEGEVDEPHQKEPEPAPWRAVALIGLLTLAVVGSAAFFVRGLYTGAPATTLAREAAVMVLALAAGLALYRRYFITDVVVAQARDDDVPW